MVSPATAKTLLIRGSGSDVGPSTLTMSPRFGLLPNLYLIRYTRSPVCSVGYIEGPSTVLGSPITTKIKRASTNRTTTGIKSSALLPGSPSLSLSLTPCCGVGGGIGSIVPHSTANARERVLGVKRFPSTIFLKKSSPPLTATICWVITAKKKAPPACLPLRPLPHLESAFLQPGSSADDFLLPLSEQGLQIEPLTICGWKREPTM